MCMTDREPEIFIALEDSVLWNVSHCYFSYCLDVHTQTCSLNSWFNDTEAIIWCEYVVVEPMSAASVTRFCLHCEKVYPDGTKHCAEWNGHPILHIQCPGRKWHGRYNNWYREHRPSCAMCNPQLEVKSEQKNSPKARAKSNSLNDTKHGISSFLLLSIPWHAIFCIYI